MNNDHWFWKMWAEPIGTWFPTKLAAVVGTVFALAIVWGVLGLPLRGTELTQMGFRGTGMAQVDGAAAIKAAMAQVAAIPPSDEPIPVEADSELAKDVYENVQVLGHLSSDNFNRLMVAITAWVAPDTGEPGQGCAYCHGEDGNFASDDYYQKVVARRMIQMTQAINAEWSTHVGATGVTCYTCHRGLNVPSQIWFDEPPEMAGVLGWRNGQNTPNPMLASTSLPGGVFSKYLVGDAQIRVIHPESRGDATGQGLKDAEHSFGLMVHMSSGLGVNCAYCHNTRAMNVWEQSPPQRGTAWYGIRMVRSLNNEYLNPLQPVYPPHRLGPTGDAPKANCATCHQGVNKPLKGTPMLTNWPELAAPGPVSDAKQAALVD
jgi:photosynthetic reaction center cytochrome c subunit